MLIKVFKKRPVAELEYFLLLHLKNARIILLQLLCVGPLPSYFICQDNVNCVASIKFKGQTPRSIWKGEFDNLHKKKKKNNNKPSSVFKAYAEFLTLLITKPSCSLPQPETMKIQNFVLFSIKLSKFWKAASF